MIAAGLVGALVAGFIVALSATAAGQRPPVKPVATAVIIPMELRAGRPVIHVTLNGAGPFLFLVSPQAETTLIDKALAAKLGLKAASRETGSQIEVQLEIGSTKLAKVPVTPTDVAPLAPEFGPATRPIGVIPLFLWKDQLVTIDYSRWRVTIESGPLPETNGQDVFDLGSSRELMVPVSSGEHAVLCRVDPLFSGGMVVPESFVKQLAVTGRYLPIGPTNTPLGVLDVFEAEVAGTLKFGSFEFTKPVIRFASSLSTGIVGGQWLPGFSIAYDFDNGRARLQRTRGGGRDRN
jgi:hypothetical protein